MTSLQREQQWHPQLPHAPTLGDTDYIFHSYSQNPFLMALHCISYAVICFNHCITTFKYCSKSSLHDCPFCFFACAGERPNLLNLLNFPSKNGNINIPKKISTKYLMFGILLLNDETGADIKTIVTRYREDAEQINLEILRLWIEGKGKPLSWDVLIDVLRTTGLGTLASDINDGLQH